MDGTHLSLEIRSSDAQTTILEGSLFLAVPCVRLQVELELEIVTMGTRNEREVLPRRIYLLTAPDRSLPTRHLVLPQHDLISTNLFENEMGSILPPTSCHRPRRDDRDDFLYLDCFELGEGLCRRRERYDVAEVEDEREVGRVSSDKSGVRHRDLSLVASVSIL